MSIVTRRIVIWGVLGLALAAGLTFAFTPRPFLIDLAGVGRAPLVVTLDEEAETRVKNVFVLSAPIDGQAMRIDLDVGDQVVAGDTIVARIEPVESGFLDRRSESEAEAAVETALAARRLAGAELEMAQAELDFSTSDLERARRLIESDTISQYRLDVAERDFRTNAAAVDTAEAALRMRDSELQQARLHLLTPIELRAQENGPDQVTITAPVAGRVLRVLRESQAVVAAGEALVEIGDPADLEIVADFLSEDAVKIAPGQRVIIDNWGGVDPLNGFVERIEPYGFTKVSALGIEEQRVNVIVELTDPPAEWVRLGHGYRVEVQVVLWEEEAVLQVPLTALFRNGGDWAVFAVEAGRAVTRHVTVGRRTGLAAQIVDGLDVGDVVVLHPSDQVVDGRRVAARQ